MKHFRGYLKLSPILCFALALLGSSKWTGNSEAPQGKKPKEVLVYYYPMFAETLTGIDDKNIESQYDITSVVRLEAPFLIKTLEAAGEPSTTFGNYTVRLKLVLPNNEVILCDLRGNVKDSRGIHRLSPGTYRMLHKMILDCFPWELTYHDSKTN